MKKLTMKDIGILTNVSQSTVSRVLNNHPNVKDEVRKKVLRCIEENEFSADINAKIMRGKSSRILGFVSAGFKNLYYLEMVEYVEKEARQRGYSVIVMNAENDCELEKYHFKELLNRNVDGIISAPVAKKNLKFLKKKNIPFVVLNENIEGIDSFYSDLLLGGKEVAKYFKKIGLKKVAYIGEINSLKYKGFIEEINSEKVVNKAEDNILFSTGKNLINIVKKHINKINLECDGYFFSSDTIALLVIKELKKKNINILDKNIVGFDNTLISQTLEISSVEQPMKTMVEKAIELLLKKKNNKIKLHEIWNVSLEPKLIKR